MGLLYHVRAGKSRLWAELLFSLCPLRRKLLGLAKRAFLANPNYFLRGNDYVGAIAVRAALLLPVARPGPPAARPEAPSIVVGRRRIRLRAASWPQAGSWPPESAAACAESRPVPAEAGPDGRPE